MPASQSRVDGDPTDIRIRGAGFVDHRFISARAFRPATVRALSSADASASAWPGHASSRLPPLSVPFSFAVTISISLALAFSFSLLLPIVVLVVIERNGNGTEGAMGNGNRSHRNRNGRIQGGHGALPHPNILANTYFDPLVGQRARQRRRLCIIIEINGCERSTELSTYLPCLGISWPCTRRRGQRIWTCSDTRCSCCGSQYV